jgi:hypothetical protein
MFSAFKSWFEVEISLTFWSIRTMLGKFHLFLSFSSSQKKEIKLDKKTTFVFVWTEDLLFSYFIKLFHVQVKFIHINEEGKTRPYALCSMLYALCSMLYALCSMLYALCSMLYALCSMLYALCSMLYALCSIRPRMHAPARPPARTPARTPAHTPVPARPHIRPHIRPQARMPVHAEKVC